MSNRLDPDQNLHSVGPDLDPNYLQMLSADNKILHWHAKSYTVQLLHLTKIVQVFWKVSPQYVLSANHILSSKLFSSINVICKYSAYDICNNLAPTSSCLPKNQGKKSQNNHFWLLWNFWPPPRSTSHTFRVHRNFKDILIAGSWHWIQLLHLYYMHYTRSSKTMFSGSEK